MNLASPIDSLEILDRKAKKLFTAGGFNTVADLVSHYPTRYEDRNAFDGWPAATDPGGAAVCLQAIVVDVQQKRVGPGRSFVLIQLAKSPDPAANAGFEDLMPGTPLALRFFHMPFVARQFAADQEVVIYGKLKPGKGGSLVMDHPEYEILSDTPPEEAAIHLQRLAPIYGARGGVPQKTFRRTVWRLLEHLRDEEIHDVLPRPSGRSEFSGMNRARALRSIHFPADAAARDLARKYLALEEFFCLQLQVLQKRMDWNRLRSAQQAAPGILLGEWQNQLPHPLTEAQQRCIREIRSDLARPHPMNRLLQGDVGSGKTYVAMAAVLLAVESGAQAAVMAPTQILAEQHYINFCRWLEPLGVRIGLRTSSRKEDGLGPLFTSGESAPQVLIGTHALLYGTPELPSLGLVVIDEQHKFGVEQRSRLIQQGEAPHVLVMTATPIPRTLTLTVYGDLDISIIDELPGGRQPIQTVVRENPDPVQVAAFLISQFDAGRQAYLVYPLIGEDEEPEAKSAIREHAAWSRRLQPWKTGLLHGRQSPAEKENVMKAFREGSLDALVATSVIEVGVDVPNASVMLIFEAERFGLAQLHQLRGRIGRGPHKSYCILATGSNNPEGLERLHTLASTQDGFAIAEADLLIRGPGDLAGKEQSGTGRLVLGDLIRDSQLVRLARRLAQTVLSQAEDALPKDPPDTGAVLETNH